MANAKIHNENGSHQTDGDVSRAAWVAVNGTTDGRFARERGTGVRIGLGAKSTRELRAVPAKFRVAVLAVAVDDAIANGSHGRLSDSYNRIAVENIRAGVAAVIPATE